MVEQEVDRFGRIGILVNNAGVGAGRAAEEFFVARTRDIFDVNVYGDMRMTKAVPPDMRAQQHGCVDAGAVDDGVEWFELVDLLGDLDDLLGLAESPTTTVAPDGR